MENVAVAPPRPVSLPTAPPRPRPRSTENDEEALIASLKAGDEESYEQLVRRYGGRMLAVAQRMCGSEDAARDVVQDAFLSAFSGIDRFRRGAQLGTWLHRITVNAALMRRRRAACRPEAQLDDLLPFYDSAGRHARSAPVIAASAEARLLRRETRRLVHDCIDRLPETSRTVLLLRDIEELDTREVAALLDVTANAVKIRLHRARLALARLISEELRGNHDEPTGI